MDIKKIYAEACDNYRLEFCKKYQFDIEDAEWECDFDFLDVNCGTYALTLSEVRYMVDNNILWETFEEWYSYTLRLDMISSEIPTPNLMSWCKGCPRKSKQEIENLETLHENVITAKELFYKSIKQDGY